MHEPYLAKEFTELVFGASDAIDFVLRSSMKSVSVTEERVPARPRLHTAAAVTSGAMSGFFGIQTLMVELPLTTLAWQVWHGSDACAGTAWLLGLGLPLL